MGGCCPAGESRYHRLITGTITILLISSEAVHSEQRIAILVSPNSINAFQMTAIAIRFLCGDLLFCGRADLPDSCDSWDPEDPAADPEWHKAACANVVPVRSRPSRYSLQPKLWFRTGSCSRLLVWKYLAPLGPFLAVASWLGIAGTKSDPIMLRRC